MPPRWIIAAALRKELDGLLTVLRDKTLLAMARGTAWSGTVEGVPVVLARTGIGGHKAKAVCAHLLDQAPCSGVVSVGYAGSLAELLKVGDLVLPTEVKTIATPPDKVFTVDKDLVSLASEGLGRGPGRIFSGRVVSADKVIVSVREKRSLGAQHAAVAVDMESAFVAELAYARAVPFLAVRAISDDLLTPLPDFNTITPLRRNRRYRQLFLYGLGHPGEVIGVLRMLLCARIATRALTRSIRGFLRMVGAGKTMRRGEGEVALSQG